MLRVRGSRPRHLRLAAQSARYAAAGRGVALGEAVGAMRGPFRAGDVRQVGFGGRQIGIGGRKFFTPDARRERNRARRDAGVVFVVDAHLPVGRGRRRDVGRHGNPGWCSRHVVAREGAVRGDQAVDHPGNRPAPRAILRRLRPGRLRGRRLRFSRDGGRGARRGGPRVRFQPVGRGGRPSPWLRRRRLRCVVGKGRPGVR